MGDELSIAMEAEPLTIMDGLLVVLVAFLMLTYLVTNGVRVFVVMEGELLWVMEAEPLIAMRFESLAMALVELFVKGVEEALSMNAGD